MDMASPFSGSVVDECIKEDFGRYDGHKFFLARGTVASDDFFDRNMRNVNPENIPAEIPLRYGFIVHYASQRVLPSQEALYSKPADVDFDELQNNALDVGTPVVIVHESLDGNWLYVFDRMHRGWVEKSKIAFCNRDDVKTFIESPDFVVVTVPKGDIYSDADLSEWYDYARMGARFLYRGKTEAGDIRVGIPILGINGDVSFESAYMYASEVNEGYLPYTPRTIIRQAFKMINQPYGWGGMYGEQDCSRFIKEVFDTVGLYLPRNSSKQILAGVPIGEYEADTPDSVKIKDLSENALAGATLLRLRGHIMLFLGFAGGDPYAIHEVWGYREGRWCGDRIRVINRVAVTDLSLGHGSKNGSWLQRTYAIAIIKSTE
jgi:hypothetical protein